MPRKAAPVPRTEYRVVVFLAGRPGSQMEFHGAKRESIRVMRRLLKPGELGSKGSVTMIRDKKPTLIAQAEVAKRSDHSLYVKELEL